MIPMYYRDVRDFSKTLEKIGAATANEPEEEIIAAVRHFFGEKASEMLLAVEWHPDRIEVLGYQD